MSEAAVHRRRDSCRVCGGSRLVMFLSLGPTPLANSFLRSPAEFPSETAFPLDLYYCEGCSFVQLLDVIDHETLFRHYLYASGTSDTIAEHNQALAATLVVVTLLAVRRLRVGPWRKALALAITTALGLGALCIELAVH